MRGFEHGQLGEVLDPCSLLSDGTYVITGGLGNLWLQLAAHIAKIKGTRIAFLTSPRFPEREEWSAWLGRDGDSPPNRKIRRLIALETKRTEIGVLPAYGAG